MRYFLPHVLFGEISDLPDNVHYRQGLRLLHCQVGGGLGLSGILALRWKERYGSHCGVRIQWLIPLGLAEGLLRSTERPVVSWTQLRTLCRRSGL